MDYLIYDFAVAETSGKLIDYTVVSGNERGEYYPSPLRVKTARRTSQPVFSMAGAAVHR